METIIKDAYAQGGAVLLLIALPILALVATFKYIVVPLWTDNKTLRERVMAMNERVAVMGEANRGTNENVAKALAEGNIILDKILDLVRGRR